ETPGPPTLAHIVTPGAHLSNVAEFVTALTRYTGVWVKQGRWRLAAVQLTDIPNLSITSRLTIFAASLLGSGQHFLLSRGVPQIDYAIKAPGRQQLSVGREGHRQDTTQMPFKGEQLLAAGAVPQLDCAIKAPGRQPLPIGREGH